MSLSSNLISQSIRINKRQDYSLLLVKVGFIKIFHYIFVTMAVKLEKKRQEKKSIKLLISSIELIIEKSG